ncbi:MAG TPA: Hsp20/alpha crystallin family protein [Afifellaceae bacterium]|nr:Hsp20/alpha crystallin family protein [Afifellaceae bacterium]
MRELAPWRWGGLREWEPEERPFEMFRRDMDTLHRKMDRLFDDMWRGGERLTPMAGMWGMERVSPRLDETEDDKAFHIRVELPGMDRDDVDVELSDGMLMIRGEKKQEEEEKGVDYYRKERSFGAFRRTLPIPAEVDEAKIDASFKKGVLCIDLPKTREAQKKVKHITVKAA